MIKVSIINKILQKIYIYIGLLRRLPEKTFPYIELYWDADYTGALRLDISYPSMYDEGLIDYEVFKVDYHKIESIMKRIFEILNKDDDLNDLVIEFEKEEGCEPTLHIVRRSEYPY